MKSQVAVIETINTARPWCGVGSAAYFTGGQGDEALRLRLIDPEPVKGAAITINTDQLYLAYYEPFLTARSRLETRSEFDGVDFALSRDIGFALGIRTDIRQRVEFAVSNSDHTGLALDIQNMLSATSSPMYADGTVVLTDWLNLTGRVEDSKESFSDEF